MKPKEYCKIGFPKNRNLSKRQTRKMQELLFGNKNISVEDKMTKKYKCNCQ